MLLRLVTLLLGQALVAAILASTTWAGGTVLGMALRRDRASTLPWALTLALGFALLAQLLLLAGMLGWLRAPVIPGIVLAIHVAAMPVWWRGLLRGTWRWPFAGLLAAIVAFPTFLLTLYPPLGFDETMYHLPYARAFAASGALPFLPALRFPIFPQLAEVLNAAVLIFTDDVATQTVGWVAGVACVGMAWTWARDLVGDGDDDAARAGGWLAIAMIVGSPIALYLAATGYVEPLLALLVTASLYAAERARLEVDARWLVAAGVLAGSAASVKYLGLYFVPAAAILLIARRAPWRVVMSDLAIYGVAAIIAMLPSYGRLIAETGSPLFPFYPHWFGPNAWAIDAFLDPQGTRWSLAITRLWDVTFRRQLVGDLPPYSPAFVAAVPIIILGAWHDTRVRRLLLVAIGFLIAAPIHAHYLFTIGPLWASMAGASAAIVLHTRIRTAATVLIAVALIIASGGEAYALYRLYRVGPIPTTSDERDRLLASQRPLYPAIAWLNRTAGPVTVYAVHAELMVDYATGTLLGDFNGPASFARLEAHIRDTGSVASALDMIGATHLLVPAEQQAWNDQAARDPQLIRVYGDEHATIYRRR